MSRLMDEEMQSISKSIISPVKNIREQIEAFWNTPIDFESLLIIKDKAPFIVMEQTAISKLHFIFVMLNIAQVNVIKRGRIVGIITKHEFMCKNKSLNFTKPSELNKAASPPSSAPRLKEPEKPKEFTEVVVKLNN